MINNTDTPLPATLEVLIQSGIDALPPDLKQVIQVAAVLGAPFDIEILRAVVGLSDIEAALDHLASRRFVCHPNTDDSWIFHHPLIGDMAYKSIPYIQRQAYHQSVAEILENRWAGTEKEHAEVLAYHLSRANQNARAFSYLIASGEHAAARSANEQATQYFEQAVQILTTLSGTTDILRWRLAIGLGDVYRALGRYSDSMAALRAGMELMDTGRLNRIQRAGIYRRMGDTSRKQAEYKAANSYFRAAKLIIGVPETPELQIELARTYTGKAWAQFHQGMFNQAQETAEHGLTYAKAAESVADQASLVNLLGGIAYNQNDWATAFQHTQQAMILREQMGFTSGVASTLGNLGILAVLKGDWSKARAFFERSLSMREDMDVEGLALVHNNLGMLLCDQGDLDQAEKHFRDSLDASKPFPHSYHTANATLGLAYVLFLKNDRDTAHEILSQALKLAEEIGANDVLTEAHRIEVEILIAEGALLPALTKAQIALENAQESGYQNHQASIWRLISTIELDLGNIKAANEALSKAQNMLAFRTNMLELGRMHLQALRIAMTQGDHAAVDDHRKTAQETFIKLGAELDLIRIRKLAEYRI